MRIFRHSKNLPKKFQKAVIAIGNFDGVHLGHESLIKKAQQIATQSMRPLAALTFEPHPVSLFKKGTEPFRLTPFFSKAHELERLGIDALIILRFNYEFSQQSAKSFITNILVKKLNASHIVSGCDFVFGSKRSGNCSLLLKAGKELGFDCTALSPIKTANGDICSSTYIRSCLRNGKLKEANLVLGRNHSIQGRVSHGEKLGRKLGFPTANIYLREHIRPKFGVYAVRLYFLDKSQCSGFNGVASIGNRPTIDGKGDILEVYIFNFKQNIYQKRVRVELIEFIRPEIKFDNLDLMINEMKRDVKKSKKILALNRNN